MLIGTQTNSPLTKPSCGRQGKRKLRCCSGCCCCYCLWCFSLCLADLPSLRLCLSVSIPHINITDWLMIWWGWRWLTACARVGTCVHIQEDVKKGNKYLCVCVCVCVCACVCPHVCALECRCVEELYNYRASESRELILMSWKRCLRVSDAQSLGTVFWNQRSNTVKALRNTVWIISNMLSTYKLSGKVVTILENSKPHKDAHEQQIALREITQIL